MVDVHDVSGEKEIVDQDHDTSVRRPDRVPNRAPKIDSQMPAGDGAVENAAGPEGTGDDGHSRLHERLRPERRLIVRFNAERSSAGISGVDAVGGGLVPPLGKG